MLNEKKNKYMGRQIWLDKIDLRKNMNKKEEKNLRISLALQGFILETHDF